MVAPWRRTTLANDVTRFERAKDTRVALCRAFKERTYVHPAARFALTPEELEAERRWSVPGPSDLEPEAAADGGHAGGETPAGEVADDDAGGPEAGEDEQDSIAA